MNQMNLNVKGAVAIAMDYVKSLDDLIPSEQLRLEETVLQESGHWFITLSFRDPGTFDDRAYKTLEIDPVRKEVLAMRIRKLDFSGFDGGVF
jgi:hypothetical protein